MASVNTDRHSILDSSSKTAGELAKGEKPKEEKKQKHVKNKAKQGKKMSEASRRFHEYIQTNFELPNQPRQSRGKSTQSDQAKGGKWYSHALKRD